MFRAKEKVIEIVGIPQSSVGAPMPVVMSDEHHLFTAYYLQNTPEDYHGSTVRIMDLDSEGEPIAIVKFPLFLAYQFGPPNDESFSGHPLANLGLEPYGTYVVKNSRWIEYFEKMNSVHSQHKKENFEKYQHFVFSFHDTTLEIIAETYEVETMIGTLRSAINKINKRLKW